MMGVCGNSAAIIGPSVMLASSVPASCAVAAGDSAIRVDRLASCEAPEVGSPFLVHAAAPIVATRSASVTRAACR
jgi:hypothetical protein